MKGAEDAVKDETVPRYCRVNFYHRKAPPQHSQAGSRCAEEPRPTCKEEAVLQ